jgi:hypothetical protein
MAGSSKIQGVSKPVRRSTRMRRQFVPELHYDATAYMLKAPKVEPVVTAAPELAQTTRSTRLGAMLDAVYSIFSSLKVKLTPSWRSKVIRKRSKAAVRKSPSKAAAPKRSMKIKAKKAPL